MCSINTENKDGINELNMDTDKDMFKLPNEEPNILATFNHDNDNLSTLSTSMKDLTVITPSLPLLMESGPLVNPPSKDIVIIGLEAKNHMSHHEQNMKNDEYDTRFVDHNGNIVTRIDTRYSKALLFK